METLYLGSPDGEDVWLSNIKPEFDEDGIIIRPPTFSCGHSLKTEIKLKPKANEFIAISISLCAIVTHENG